MPGNGAQFTGTKVQILTPEELRASHQSSWHLVGEQPRLEAYLLQRGCLSLPFLFLIHFFHFFPRNSCLFLEASQPMHAHLSPSLPSSVFNILRHENSCTTPVSIGREKERDRETEYIYIYIY